MPSELADPTESARLVAGANRRGDLTALVLSHAQSIDSSILTTTLDSWDRHYAVNARASWLLINAFAETISDAVQQRCSGRIVALTSDHTAHNLAYGSSKGALDRIVTAAAVELAPLGISTDVLNPGPIDTGCMDDATWMALTDQTPGGRLGTPEPSQGVRRPDP